MPDRDEMFRELVTGTVQKALRAATPRELAMQERIAVARSDVVAANGKFVGGVFTSYFILGETELS